MPTFAIPNGAVAQMVEQWTENPCVGSSILPSTTKKPLTIVRGFFCRWEHQPGKRSPPQGPEGRQLTRKMKAGWFSRDRSVKWNKAP